MTRPVGYVNLGSAVHSTWAGCDDFGEIERALTRPRTQPETETKAEGEPEP